VLLDRSASFVGKHHTELRVRSIEVAVSGDYPCDALGQRHCTVRRESLEGSEADALATYPNQLLLDPYAATKELHSWEGQAEQLSWAKTESSAGHDQGPVAIRDRVSEQQDLGRRENLRDCRAGPG